MIHVPDYMAEGTAFCEQQVQELDALCKADPTQLEMVTDSGLNLQWHELMNEEQKLMTKLNVVKLGLADYKNEMNRRVFRRTLEACIAAYDTVAE